MDCLSVNNPIQEIVFMKASQVGGTELGNNWLGYIIHHAPAPTMAVLPSLELAKRNSRQRIDPMIDACPVLKEKVGEKNYNDSTNTILSKDFPGGTLILTGANSPSGLKSTPARNMFFDEVDEYPKNVGEQGDAVELGKARSRTFSKRKWFMVSTPTIEHRSKIAELFEETDKRYYFVPCPECKEFQRLEFSQLKWQEGRPETTYYECLHCKYHIKNWQKTGMLKRGKWTPTNKDHANPKVVGFHISSLYSPVGWYSWEELVGDWLKAQGNPEKLKTFINTALGETWKEKSEAPDWHRLYERREQYKTNVVPKGVGFLTCGVDVQQDRLELEIVGWCRGHATYSIDYRVLRGDTSAEEVWFELTKILSESWPVADSGLHMPIKLMAVDSGYNTQHVYNWVRKFPSNRVIAVKGQDNLNIMVGHPRATDVTLKGKTIRRGLKVWPVGSSLIKSELYGWLRQDKATDGQTDTHGYCHFPEYGPDFFKMLTAEELKSKFVKGFRKTEWEKIRERNEALDCRAYARAAAYVCGIDRFTEENWRALETQIRPAYVELKKEELGTVAPSSQTPKKKRESSWL